MRVVTERRIGSLAILTIALVGGPLGPSVAVAQTDTPGGTVVDSSAGERSRPDDLTIFTTYPSIVADPGDEALFPLTVDSPQPERVDLSVGDLPEGFEVTFRGGGSIVQSVHTGGEELPELELRVVIPDTATPGAQAVLIAATAESGSTAELPVEVVVADLSEGSVSLTADFAALRGDSEDTFSFDLDLANDTSTDIDFGLEGEGPEGWVVTVQPSSEEQAATTQVAAGDSEGVRATVTPAFQAEAGVYPVIVRAVGGDRTAEALLSVEITGTYAMELTTLDGRLNTSVSAGSSTDFGLIVVNSGSAALTDVTLDASSPQGWEVEFTPEEIPTVGIGETLDVVARITPVGNAVAGDYVITIDARSAEADDEISLRTTVETSTLWGVIGIAIIALVLVGLAVVFRIFGRR